MMDLFLGNMDAIMEYLHTHKVTTSANNTTVVTTYAIVVATTDSDTALVGTLIQPIVNQPIYHPAPSRHATAYPRGMPLNYTPQFSNGSAFVPYQPFVVPFSNGNDVAYPWSMPTPQVVDADKHEIHQGHTHQNYMPVVTEVPNDHEPEY